MMLCYHTKNARHISNIFNIAKCCRILNLYTIKNSCHQCDSCHRIHLIANHFLHGGFDNDVLPFSHDRDVHRLEYESTRKPADPNGLRIVYPFLVSKSF